MTASGNFHAISVDLNSCPTVSEPTISSSSALFKRTSYSRLLRKFAAIDTLSFACSFVCIVFDLIFTLIILGIGANNQSVCPIEPRIPIYMIVLGSVNLVSLCFSIIACIIRYRDCDTKIIGFYFVHCSAVIIILLQLFNFIWMIVGSVWIFRSFNTVQYASPDQSTTYCQVNLYQFAVVSLIFQYILPFIFCCCKNIPLHY